MQRLIKLIVSIEFSILAAIAWPAVAQTTAVMGASAPGKAGVAKTVKFTASDHRNRQGKTRDVTLKGPKGNEVTAPRSAPTSRTSTS